MSHFTSYIDRDGTTWSSSLFTEGETTRRKVTANGSDTGVYMLESGGGRWADASWQLASDPTTEFDPKEKSMGFIQAIKAARRVFCTE